MSFGPVTQPKKSVKFAIQGPPGAGKTHWGLAILIGLCAGKPVAMLDSESERGKLFAKKFDFEYDSLTNDFSPNRYVRSIAEACGLNLNWPLPPFTKAFDTIPDLIRESTDAPFGGLLIDSLTHAWDQAGGVLDQVNKAGGNSFTDGWGKLGTPLQNRLMQSIIKAPIHVGCTIRTKMEYVIEEKANKSGVMVSAPRKVGLAPVQRDNTAYEFDYIFEVDMNHMLTVSKCPPIDGMSGAQYNPTIEDLELLIATIITFNEAGVVQEIKDSPERLTAAKEQLVAELVPAYYPTVEAIAAAMMVIPNFPAFSVKGYGTIKKLLVEHVESTRATASGFIEPEAEAEAELECPFAEAPVAAAVTPKPAAPAPVASRPAATAPAKRPAPTKKAPVAA